MNYKKQLRNFFIVLTIFLAFFPFITTFNEVGARIVQNLGFSQWLQQWIVPIEVKMISSLLMPFGVKLALHGDSTIEANGILAHVTWNCIGWQSLLLVGLSLIMGLQGSYTRSSKLQAIAIGILGAYIINLFRMAIVIGLLVYSQPLFAFVYHDILAIIVTIFWLFLFWWFAYRFVLEEEQKVVREEVRA